MYATQLQIASLNAKERGEKCAPFFLQRSTDNQLQQIVSNCYNVKFKTPGAVKNGKKSDISEIHNNNNKNSNNNNSDESLLVA